MAYHHLLAGSDQLGIQCTNLGTVGTFGLTMQTVNSQKIIKFQNNKTDSEERPQVLNTAPPPRTDPPAPPGNIDEDKNDDQT